MQNTIFTLQVTVATPTFGVCANIHKLCNASKYTLTIFVYTDF